MAFQIQQCLFARQSSGIAGQLAVAADNAMAGNDDGDFVCTVSGSYCTNGFGISQSFGLLFVAARIAIRYGLQDMPNLLLKRCTD